MVPEPPAFRNTMIILPLLTYAFVAGIAWYMRPDRTKHLYSMWWWLKRGRGALVHAKWWWAKSKTEAVEAFKSRTSEKNEELPK